MCRLYIEEQTLHSLKKLVSLSVLLIKKYLHYCFLTHFPAMEKEKCSFKSVNMQTNRVATKVNILDLTRLPFLWCQKNWVWRMLYKGMCCTMVYVVQGCVLYNGVCCTRVCVVQGCMLYKGVCCTRVCAVQWRMLYKGVCCTRMYVVQGCMLYKGVCCTRVCAVQWRMLYKGVCCTRMYVVQGCMLYKGVWNCKNFFPIKDVIFMYP